MGAVYKKEFKAYFSNMTGYVFIAFILLFAGIFVSMTNLRGGYPNFEYSLGTISFTFLFVVPILTMRVLAEEKRSRTDQLLYSLPISVPQIIMGKYLAMLTVFAIPCGVMLLYPIILSFYGTVAVLTAYSAIFGFFMLGAALIAIGMFMSSLTESQIISAVLSFGALLLIYLMSNLSSLIPSTAAASYISFAVLVLALALIVYVMTKNYWAAFSVAAALEIALSVVYFTRTAMFEGAVGKLLSSLALYGRLDNFIYGIFDITSVIYYLTVIVIFVFFSIQSVEKRRWS
ncbi:MAG: ABC transporter permease [Eubacteriales bacterium]